VLSNIVTTRADRVAGSAVRAEHGSVTVEEFEITTGTGVVVQTSAVEDVVGLVGSVTNITPNKSSDNYEPLGSGFCLKVV
jgi:hypothetical protein